MKKKAKEAPWLLSALKYWRFLCFKRLTSEIQPLLIATIVFSKMNDKFPLWYYQPKVVSLYIYALKV